MVMTRLAASLAAVSVCLTFSLRVAAESHDQSVTSKPAGGFLSTLTDEERAFLRAHPVVRVAHDPVWPPIEFSNERGELTGMSSDYLDWVEAQLGVRFERVSGLTWQEAYERLQRWELDMAPCVAMTAERTAFWAFTEPFLTVPVVIATQLDVPYVSETEELVGKKVSVVDGYAIDAWLSKDFPGIEIVRTRSPVEGIQLLQRGEVFAYVDNLLVLSTYQATSHAPSIKVAGQTRYLNAQRMAVRRDWSPLASIIDKALRAMPEARRREIYRKWVPTRAERQVDYTTLWQVLFGFLAVLAVLAWWNRRLVREVSRRTQAEARLLASEATLAQEKQWLSVTLRSIGDGVITADVAANVVLLNPVAEQLCGWSEHEALGKSASTVFQMIDGEPGGALERVLREGVIVRESRPVQLRARDGVERLVEVSAAPIKHDDSETGGAVLVFRDVTERQKLLEAALRSERLEALSVLAGGVAHDFNNLLTGFFASVELAKTTTARDNAALIHLDRALATLVRAKGLSQQLLTFAKGGAPVRSVGSLIRPVEEGIKFALSGSKVLGRFEIDSELWHCDFDEAQIARAIDNLVINAVQAMPEGGTLTVSAKNVMLGAAEIDGLAAGAYVMLTFSDTGTGIDPTVVGRIFDPFFTTKTAGTGLGLAAAYSIIKRHDGHIALTSRPGEGTTFRVYLPASPSEAPASQASIDHVLPHTGRGRVLVMDDEAAIRLVMAEMLHMLGYEVTSVENGNDAVAAIRTASTTGAPFVAAIVDLTIPGGFGGAGVVAELRRQHVKLPVFVSSGYSEDPVMADPTRHGFADVLRKPFTFAELERMLGRHFGPGVV